MNSSIKCHPINLCRVTWKCHGKKVEDARWTCYSTPDCNPQKFAECIGENIETFLRDTYIKDDGEKHLASIIKKTMENIGDKVTPDVSVMDLATPNQLKLLTEKNAGKGEYFASEYIPMCRDSLKSVGVDIIQPHIEVSACMEQSFWCEDQHKKFVPVYERMFVSSSSNIKSPMEWRAREVNNGRVLFRISCKKKTDIKMTDQERGDYVQKILRKWKGHSSTITQIVGGNHDSRIFIKGKFKTDSDQDVSFEYHSRVMESPFIKKNTPPPPTCNALMIPVIETTKSKVKGEQFGEKLHNWREGKITPRPKNQERSSGWRITRNEKTTQNINNASKASSKVKTCTIKKANVCDSKQNGRGWSVCDDISIFLVD